MAVGMAKLLDFGTAAGLPFEQVQASLNLYLVVLDGIPTQDIEDGVLKVLREHKYSNMPTPGELYQACLKKKSILDGWDFITEEDKNGE